MIQSKRENYKNWSEDEISQLIQVARIYRTDKVDWAKVQKHFPERSCQQLKSFYNNRIKQYVFKEENGVPQAKIPIVLYGYYQMITNYIPENETLEEKVKRVFIHTCWEDVLANVVFAMSESENFDFHKKLLVAMREGIKIHWHEKPILEEAFKNNANQIRKHGFDITKEQWDKFQARLNAIELDLLMERINKIVGVQ
ncbi:Myb-like_DNA-binding domain-containing protein [Hexamita inflata]|uniref:Myb-like DNA-binding domain-containing protein n=1 Tax=Hexamita inflata TaxID=28002 RepID=A0AA86PSQ2_9EUKA|nr:Myb-like DNA-binding domain-containing protein [Hexamita inflata]